MTASALFLIIIKNFYFQRFQETQYLFKMWHNADAASALIRFRKTETVKTEN